MDNSIIVAIITGTLTLTGTVIANYSMRKKDAIANAVRDQKIEDKLQALSDRVDAHNGVMDKVTNIEKSIVRIETKLEGK
jgi:outer membrane murein-binding lipoprotein Lpp